MKSFRRFVCLFILLALLLQIVTTALASELQEEPESSCKITISIIDQSGGYPGEKIKAVFKAGDGENAFEIPKNESWGKGMVVEFSIPAPADYTVTFEGLEDGYAVIDTLTNSSDKIQFSAKNEGIKDFYWSFVKEEQLGGSSAEEEEKPTKSNGSATDRDEIKVTNQEAEKAYREFLDAVSFIETDPSWYDGIAATLNQYGEDSINYNIYSQWYADYVQNGTQEEYFAMSAYEQFLWTETYTRLANAVNSEWGFSHYFKNKDTFHSSFTRLIISTMNGENHKTVEKAYLALMDWQYDYIMANNEPFNFIRNRSYREESKKPPVLVDKPDDMTEKEEIEQAIEEAEEDRSIWGETMEILARNSLSIIILLVLGAVLFVLYYIRKTKNVDSDES